MLFTVMDIEEARQFLRENHNAVVCTMRQNGEPAMSPITVGVDHDGYVIISSRETAFKVKHLRRDPRVWLCCLTRQFYGEWHLIKGRATIVSLPDAMEGLVEYYRGISGEHPDWDDYRRAMEQDKRVLIRVAIEEVGPQQQG
jgi:PPOX class probable F420-dependent enzyme